MVPHNFDRMNNGHSQIQNMQDMEESFQTDDVYAEDVGYGNKTILMVCGFLFFLDILINVDHGALPSAAVSIKTEFDMPNVKFGTLGSMVYLGLVSGSLCGAMVLGKFQFKTVLVVSFLGNGAGLLLFIMNDNFYAMSFSRFISGFFQVFLTIYIPLYCDCFGTPITKPYMLSLILLAGPLGLVTGFGCTGLLLGYGISWRYSFLVQGLSMVVAAFLVCLFPSRFININECVRLKREMKDFRNKQLYQTRRNQMDGEIGGTH